MVSEIRLAKQTNKFRMKNSHKYEKETIHTVTVSQISNFHISADN